MPRLFVSQAKLDKWLEQGRIELEQDTMTLDDGRRFRLVEGVAFDEIVGDDQDLHELVGTVKTKAQLEVLAAEHFPGSVVVGDAAYEVTDGFAGEPLS